MSDARSSLGARPSGDPQASVGALAGVRVLDATDLAGALGARLLGDLGADVVRIEPPGGAWLRAIGPAFGEPSDRSFGQLDSFYNSNKRAIVVDPLSAEGAAELRQRIAHADVLIDADPPGLVARAGIGADEIAREHPHLVHLRITPFGLAGPRAGARGSDLVCAAAAGMAFINGHPGAPPIAPFGLQAYNSAGLFAALGAVLALLRRARSGRGGAVDLSIQAAAAAAVEHVTGFYRQSGAVEERRGTLHWSRTFRIARCRDGEVLLCLLGDWTTLVEWVTRDGEALLLRDPRWEDLDERKRACELLFDELDRWAAPRSAAEIAETAQLLRLPFARVRTADELAADPQLQARGFPIALPACGTSPGAIFPGAFARFSDSPWRLTRRPSEPPADGAEVRADPSWSGARRPLPSSKRAALRPLGGITVLDFTWVVAGPVATRLLADHGARVIKVERKNATDFGSRRGGLTGNLNRGKESIVLDLARPRGLEVARRLAARSDVVIDNFSARVMGNLGLDYPSLRSLKPDVIAVSMSGFGHSGPWRDHVSYGPTLQALVGFPLLMRLPGEPPAGWGYSWSDMAGGISAALATVAALLHRDRTGRGQWIDVSQYENLIALLGPAVFDALGGRDVPPPGNDSQEGAAVPHGIYRCAAGRRADGSRDDDRWLALAVLDDDAWSRLAGLLAADGCVWAAAPELRKLAGRSARRGEIDRALEEWTRPRAAEDLQARLQRAGVAASVVANGEDLCLRDPTLAARGFFRSAASPEGEAFTFDGIPFAGDGIGSEVRAPGPLLGEHTDRVLREVAGLSDDEIAALREDGAVA